MTRAIVLTLIVLCGISLAWSQTPEPTTVGATNPDPVNFTGQVTGYTTSDIRVNRYSFAAGARSNWHTHERGQTLIIEQGVALAQVEGGPVREYRPNDVFYTPPGARHWHGAAPAQAMRQVSVSFGVTTWHGPVSDAQYRTAR